jgi:hypothetical protein
MDQRLEDLFQFIESTANSIKVLEGTDMPQVRELIERTQGIPEGCPSLASAVEFYLRGIAGRTEELQDLIKTLIREVATKEENGEL